MLLYMPRAGLLFLVASACALALVLAFGPLA